MLAKNRKLNLADAAVRQRLRTFSRKDSSIMTVNSGKGKPAGMVVVSKTVSKKATTRNKIKRHLYVVIEKLFIQRPQLQLVVRVKRNREIPFLITEFTRLVSQI